MPRVTIWIRNEDMPKWEAIENRPEWLHEHLNGLLKAGEDYRVTFDLSKLPSEPTYTPPEDVA